MQLCCKNYSILYLYCNAYYSCTTQNDRPYYTKLQIILQKYTYISCYTKLSTKLRAHILHTYMYYVLVMYYTITCVTSFIYVCLQQLTKKLKKRLAILADILNVAGYIYRASTIHYIFVMQ